MLVAIDTATAICGLALYDGQLIWAEETWRTQGHHTAEVMPSLVRIMGRCGVTPQQVVCVAVSLGPGSYTGLRIGLSLAKGIALALSIPLVGVPTLDVMAYAHRYHTLPVWAIIEAGRSRICAALYAQQEGHWQQVEPEQVTSWEEFCNRVKGPAFVCGEMAAAGVELLKARLGETVVIGTVAESLRRAGYLAEIAWQRYLAGDVDDPVTLSPHYLQTSIPSDEMAGSR